MLYNNYILLQKEVIYMTMRELARIANVSVSTVSKAFLDAEDVSNETKQHIFNIAREQGCYGKFYKGKFPKKIIAVICPELKSNYYTCYVEKLQELIESNNGIVLISSYNFDSEKQAELIDYYSSYLQVDGIIVFNLCCTLKKSYDIPIVSLFSSGENNVDSIEIDFYSPIFESICLLKEHGHSNISFFCEPLTEYKVVAFLKAIKEFPKLQGKVIYTEHRFGKAGRDCVNKLLDEKNDYTAIICSYDDMAIGAIKQLKNLGYSVPDDFSIIGIDNITFSEFVETSLTTIDTNIDEMCMIAIDLLYKKLKNKFFRSNQKIVITGRLIERETVSKARK